MWGGEVVALPNSVAELADVVLHGIDDEDDVPRTMQLACNVDSHGEPPV